MIFSKKLYDLDKNILGISEFQESGEIHLVSSDYTQTVPQADRAPIVVINAHWPDGTVQDYILGLSLPQGTTDAYLTYTTIESNNQIAFTSEGMGIEWLATGTDQRVYLNLDDIKVVFVDDEITLMDKDTDDTILLERKGESHIIQSVIEKADEFDTDTD